MGATAWTHAVAESPPRADGQIDATVFNSRDYLRDLGAFMVQTWSVTSLRDGNAGVMRALLELTPSSAPMWPLHGVKGQLT